MEPDIRTVLKDTPPAIEIIDEKIDANNNLSFYCRYTHPFTNFSFRSGFINTVEFVPAKINFAPEIVVQYINKVPIGWREEREVEVLFLATIQALQLDEYMRHNENGGIPMAMKFYDNKGNSIKDSEEGTPIEVQFRLSLKSKGAFTLNPDGSRSPIPSPTPP